QLRLGHVRADHDDDWRSADHAVRHQVRLLRRTDGRRAFVFAVTVAALATILQAQGRGGRGGRGNDNPGRGDGRETTNQAGVVHGKRRGGGHTPRRRHT